MSIINEESGEPLPKRRLADDDTAIFVFVFESAVNLASALTHIDETGQNFRRRTIEQFWKLADSELWPRSV